CNAPLDTPPFRGPAAVVRNRGHVLDAADLDPRVLQRADGGLAARARALHQHIDLAHAVLHGPSGALLGSQLGGERCRLAGALEPDVAGRRPRQDVALHVGDGHDGVVEGALDVRDPVGHVLAFAPPRATASRLRLRHYFLTFFFPATVFLGPLRLRALVWVRWPWTGRPRRWRMPA